MIDNDFRENGVRIDRAHKEQKVDWGRIRFHKLLLDYDILIINEINNVICFQIEDRIYYYGIPSQKIREEGSNEWTGKIITKLKSDFGGYIPHRDY